MNAEIVEKKVSKICTVADKFKSACATIHRRNHRWKRRLQSITRVFRAYSLVVKTIIVCSIPPAYLMFPVTVWALAAKLKLSYLGVALFWFSIFAPIILVALMYLQKRLAPS